MKQRNSDVSSDVTGDETATGDDKYDKMREQQQKFRRLILLVVGVFVVCLSAVKVMGSKRQHTYATLTHGSGGHDGEHAMTQRRPPIAEGLGGVRSPHKPKVADAAPPAALEATIAKRVSELDAQVRAIKKTGVIMETDPTSLEATGKLQEATRRLIKARYGDYGTQPYRVKLDLEFQESIPDFAEKGGNGELLLEMAPIALVPCSVFNFLEIARGWNSGAFHRNAGHVLQVNVHSTVTKPMPFQEYSKEYPHKKGTVGYAGRPSGPAFYVSIQDNTANHGPGSQQKKNPHEADSIIGKVIGGGMDDVVPRIHTMPGREFLPNKKDWVVIKACHILVPGDGPGGYIEWKGRASDESTAKS